ncbi:UPF0175 family protein, partial [uncultured Thiodictyon sp.]|uniref:UPF0175 family protein n=1 Tax=uncultured Thiodictyon sp. TaxID=1846217 RepID=UPI0025E07BB4
DDLAQHLILSLVDLLWPTTFRHRCAPRSCKLAQEYRPGRFCLYPLSKALDSGDYLLITRHGKPIGIAAAFDDGLLDLGFRKWIAVRSFQAGDLSLGQVAQVFEKSREETMRLLSDLGVPIADYDLADDLETLALLGGN